MWGYVSDHGRGIRLGHCTHPSVARLTYGSDTCRFYVRGTGNPRARLDLNVSMDAFDRFVAQGRPLGVGGNLRPRLVDTDLLREKSKRDQEWGHKR